MEIYWCILEHMGSAVCHQMAERSFIWQGHQMPLCARCTGIYTGVLLAFGFYFFRKRMAGNKPFLTSQLVLSAMAILLLGADGFFSYMGIWHSNNLLRVVSGTVMGVALPGLILLAGNFDPTGLNEISIYQSTGELLLLMAFSLFWGLCLWKGLPILMIGAAVSVTGEICLWASVFWMILRNVCLGKRLPYWRISLCTALGILFLAGLR